MMDEFGDVAGVLSIRRPDGAVYINYGVPNHSLTMQRNEFRHPDIGWTGQNYYSDAAYYKTYENIYAYHDARYLTVALGVALQAGSPSASAYINVRVREFSNPDGNASGTQRIIAYRDQGTNFKGITLDLGVPTYQPRQFYLEFCFDGLNPSGNVGLVRRNREVMRG